MAKKKGARKTASRGARKAAKTRRGARKAAARPRRALTSPTVPGLDDPKQVNLGAIKQIIAAHIDRLKQGPSNAEVEKALNALEQSRQLMSSGCANNRISMVIEFPS